MNYNKTKNCRQDQSQKISTIGNTPEPWLKITPSCHHLGISIPTMRRWIKQGIVTPKRTPGGEYRFLRSELDNLLK